MREADGQVLHLLSEAPRTIERAAREAFDWWAATRSSVARQIGGVPDLEPLRRTLISKRMPRSTAASLHALAEGGWRGQQLLFEEGRVDDPQCFACRSAPDWNHSYIISGKGAYPPETDEGSFVQFEAPVEMKELVGFHREVADYASEAWTREGLTPLSKVTSAVDWDGRVNLLPAEGKLAAVGRRIMSKRPPVERREEGAELPDKVPTLPVRLDFGGGRRARWSAAHRGAAEGLRGLGRSRPRAWARAELGHR